MKLKLKREGGFAGQILEREIDLQDLPANLQASVTSLLKIPKPKKGKTNPLLRDGFLYTVEWSGKKGGKAQFDESTLPDDIRKVIGLLL